MLHLRKQGLDSPLTLLVHANGGLDADRSAARVPQPPHCQHPPRVPLHRAGRTAAGQQLAALTTPTERLNDQSSTPRQHKCCAGGMCTEGSLHLRPCRTHPGSMTQHLIMDSLPAHADVWHHQLMFGNIS
jgi:hypothetical protein